MVGWLKQSTAATVKVGPFVDSTDGNTQETGLSLAQADVQLSKNGGTFAQMNASTALPHDANGWYGIPLNTTDTGTLGMLTMFIHKTGALAVHRDYMVVPANVWDSFFGADALQVHANEITNGLITAAAVADGAIDIATFAADCKTGSNLNAQVKAQDNIDFGALQKTSLNAATPASVTGAVGSVTGAVGSVTGNVGGSVASVTGAVGSVTGAVGSVTGNVGGSVGSLATQAKADVNAEVVDALNTDTYAEPGQEAPGATVSLVKKIGYLYKAWRNKRTQTATVESVYADDATTVDQKRTVSDDGTTATKGEMGTGP